MPDTNINEILAQQQAIEARLLELKEIAWKGGTDLDKTNVTTAIIPSIYSYVKNEQEGVITTPTDIILNINGNQYIINNQNDDNEAEEDKNYNFNLTIVGQFIENPGKAEHFVQDTITDADFTEIPGDDEEPTPASLNENEEIIEENIPATVDINLENIEDYHIDDLKQQQYELSQDYVELEAQRWIDFVLNLIAYINDFGSIVVKTVHDGEYQIDTTTNFGIIATGLDEDNNPTYEATSVNTIFITTETATTAIETNETESDDNPAIWPDNSDILEDEVENTENRPDDTEIIENHI